MNYFKQTAAFIITLLSTFTAFAQWTPINTGTLFSLHKIEFADSLNGFILGEDNSQIIVLRTTDGGYTWNQILPGRHAFELDFLNANEGVIVGQDSVYKTFDGGVSWISNSVNIPSGNPHTFHNTPFFNMRNGSEWLMVKPQGTRFTTNAGTTWAVNSQGNLDPIPINPEDVHKLNDSSFIGIGWYGPFIYTSSDWGMTWSGTYIMDGVHYSLSFQNQNQGFIISKTNTGINGIYKTTDGGVNLNISHQIDGLKHIRYVNDSCLYAVGDSGLIVKTCDSGITWSQDSSGTSINLNKIYYLMNKGIIIGDSGTILMNTNIPAYTVDIKKVSNSEPSWEPTLFPNPSNGTFTIQTNQSSDESTHLIIYNANGGEVSEFTSLSPLQTIDLSGQPKGFYYAVFQTGSRIFFQKIVIL